MLVWFFDDASDGFFIAVGLGIGLALLSFVYQHFRNKSGEATGRWAVASVRASIVFVLVQLLMKSAIVGGMAVGLGVGVATLLLKNRSRMPPNAM